MEERMLTEREAFRAARCFLQQFNEREHSEAIMLLISWMEEDTWDHDALETSDPAQWHDWVGSVDRVIAERARSEASEHRVEVIESSDGTASWRCSCGAGSGGTPIQSGRESTAAGSAASRLDGEYMTAAGFPDVIGALLGEEHDVARRTAEPDLWLGTEVVDYPGFGQMCTLSLSPERLNSFARRVAAVAGSPEGS